VPLTKIQATEQLLSWLETLIQYPASSTVYIPLPLSARLSSETPWCLLQRLIDDSRRSTVHAVESRPYLPVTSLH
jgi:hypothetical protein